MNHSASQRIYLDYAATSPLRREAAEAMRAARSGGEFNPSSAHAEGRRARAILDDARERVAAVLGAARKEIVFTASGTEADHLALAGAVRARGGKGHVVAGAIEHHAVLNALRELREMGCDVTLLGVDERGRVDPADFAAALRADTVIASVMYANNEIGTVQPVAELASIARGRGVLFHTDAVQAPGWLPFEAGRLGVDLLSLSSHKFGGPAGVGVLYVRAGTPLSPVIPGGGQEYGRRSGTENVVGIAGLARALELAAARPAEMIAEVARRRDLLETGVLASVRNVRVNGAGAIRLPNIASLSFPGVDPEALLMRLDLEGVAVSAGSACTSGVLERSHVIEALRGKSPREEATIRFSLGPETTDAEIERVLGILPPAVAALRAAEARTEHSAGEGDMLGMRAEAADS